MLGLSCRTVFSLVAASRGYSSVATHRLLIAVVSLVVEDGLWGMRASVTVARGLNSCGSWALEDRLSSYNPHRLN